MNISLLMASIKPYNYVLYDLIVVNEKQLEFVKLKRLTKNPSITHPTIDLDKKTVKELIGED